MKKLCIVFILIILSIATILPLTAFATESNSQTTTEENIHLLNPVEITYYNDKVFIADNVADNESVIHIFDVSGTQPKFIDTINFEGNTTRLQTIADEIYILQSNKYLVMNTTDYSLSSYPTSSQRIDMTVVNNTQYILKSNGLYSYSNGIEKFLTDFSNGKSILAVDNKVYFLYGNNYRYYDETTGISQSTVAVSNDTKGLVNVNGEIATFTDTTFTLGELSVTINENNSSVRDVVANGNDLYVISDNKVLKWTKSKEDETYIKQQDYVIGSDTVQLTPPTLDNITSYTQATAISYPANIIYKSTGDNSIPNLIDNGQEKDFIILGYEGDSQHNYYYVYVDGAFGWIKKSAQQATSDTKLKITDTTVGTSVINYKTHFVTANAVFLYHLPCVVEDKENYIRTKFTQTTDNRAEVTLLQQFTASDGTQWYYVTYTHNNSTNFGFVLKSDVGAIYSSSTTNEITLDKETPNLKINSSLWDNVTMYMTQSLLPDQQLVDENTGEVIKLTSGTRVNVIERTQTASYLQVVNSNGTFYYGWVSNENLININAPTTNTVIGATLIAISLVLTVTTIAVARRRKKVGERNPVIDIDSND